MRKISLWAKNNPRTARVYIILIKILLAAIAWIISRLLFAMDIILPGSLGVSALLVFFLAAMLYPSKDRTILTRKYFYIKQKSCDFTLAACTFVMMVSIINNQQYRIAATALHASSSITSNKTPTAEEILTSLNYRDKKTLTKQEKRILKQEFKKQLHVFTKAILAGDKKKIGSDGMDHFNHCSCNRLNTFIVRTGLLHFLRRSWWPCCSSGHNRFSGDHLGNRCGDKKYKKKGSEKSGW